MTHSAPVVETRDQEDHRTRVAREKRKKTRAHLLKSVLATCGNLDKSRPAVINDVVEHAGVSRGTFYKHFDSLEEAVAELGGLLADEMTVGIYGIYDVLTDARARTATGVQVFLNRAMQDHNWGSFIAHIGLLSEENNMTRKIVSDIQLGVDTQRYQVSSVEAAADLLIGTKIEAIQRIIEDNKNERYIRDITQMILTAFGTPPSEAERMVEAMAERLYKEGPTMLAWWKPNR